MNSERETPVDQRPRETRTPVYQEVQQSIEELVRKGEIRLGEKLPPERALAERFGVSRNSVREAIRGLTEKNFLESRRGDGTYVLSPLDASPAEPLKAALASDKKNLREIFEFRRILEPPIAALAAGRISKRQVKDLKTLVFEQEKRRVQGKDDADLDAQFHMRIAEAANNKSLLEVLKTLDHILAASRSGAVRSEERQMVSMRTHYLIVDALERGDPNAAQQAMTTHLLEIEAAVLGAQGKGSDGIPPQDVDAGPSKG